MTYAKHCLKAFKKSVYNALLNSQLTYAITVWGGSLEGDLLKPLFLLQKRALRNLFGLRKVSKHIKAHTKRVFYEHNILTVYNIYNYMTVISLFKLIKQKVPLTLCKLLNIDGDDCILKARNKRLKITIPKLRLNRYQNTFCYQAPKLWNLFTSSKLAYNEITAAPSLNSLRTRLKKFLLEMQNYGDNDWQHFNKSIKHYFVLLSKVR